MKQLTNYAPYFIASGAILAAVYFLWYKPRKEAEDAKNAALQAEADAKLSTDSQKYQTLRNTSAADLQTHAAVMAAFNMN